MKKTRNYIWLLKPNVNFRKLQLTLKIGIILLLCGLALPAYSLAAEKPSGSNSPGTDAVQQLIKVSGTITDASSNQAMIGVNVTVKGTTIGGISDVNGKFSVSVPNANATLVFSFIGYVTQEIPLAGQTTLNVALAAEVSQLSEVVVVGYGTQKKVTATGSVVSTKGEEILK